MSLFVREIKTPIGVLTMIAKGNKLIRLDFGAWENNEQKIMDWCKRFQLPTVFEQSTRPFELIEKQLQDYFLGNNYAFDVDYELYGTSFQIKVWNKLAEFVKHGETRSYLDLATAINNPKAVRAIGGAVNKNPISIIIPCHRIIGKNRQLIGFGGGLDKKIYLLELENNRDYVI